MTHGSFTVRESVGTRVNKDSYWEGWGVGADTLSFFLFCVVTKWTSTPTTVPHSFCTTF